MSDLDPNLDDPNANIDPPANDPPADPPAGDPPPSNDPPSPPADDDWRTRMSGGDEKLLGFLARIPSEKAAIERLKRHEDDLKAGKYVRPLSAEATDEELAAYRKENGIPETATAYMESLPEGLVIGDDDKPYVEQFMEAMHGLNAKPEVVNTALDTYFAIQQSQLEEQAIADKAADDACVEALRDEWGADFKRNQNVLRSYLETLPQEVSEAIRGGRDNNGTPLSMNPAVLRWLAAEAMERNPVSVVVPGAGGNQAAAIADEIAKYEKMMATNRRAWNSDDKAQERYRELLEARDKLAA